ncbi:MAG: PD40 domain-containing protein [Chloroflexi bacterium]|nr:PD40 domain-containing protein [Chloroflexota bacterium]
MTWANRSPGGAPASTGSASLLLAVQQTRRRFLRGLSAVGAAAALWSAAPSTAGRALAAESFTGLLAVPRARDIVLVRPTGDDDRTVLSLQVGEFVADVALSPDSSRVAYGMFTARTGDGPGGSDIVITTTAPGGERIVVAPRDRPGMLLAAPYWAPDGSGLLFEAVGLGANNLPSISAEWIDADGSGRRTVVTQARYPSISPDGQKVVYTLARQTGDALYEQPLAGGEAREIIPEGQFLVIAYPRYSPDGSQIAFAGVADSAPTGLPPRPLTPSPTVPKLLPSLDRWRGVAAHGFPAEPWLVPAAGGEARQLAPLPVDDAAIAWSPDGSALASSGANGIFLIGAADGSVRRISENGSFGAIDWR